MATKYTISFTKLAQEDINDVFEYIANHLLAPTAAHNLMSEIKQKIQNMQ